MTTPEALLRRINTLTSVLVLIAVVALSGLLYALDARENQRNATGLQVLSLVEDLPTARQLLGDRRALAPGVYAWLDAPAQVKLDDRRAAARQTLVDWLAGLHRGDTLRLEGGPAALERLAGKPGRSRSRPEGPPIPFYLFAVGLAQSDRLEPPNPRAGAVDSLGQTVAASIRHLRRLGGPTRLRMATRVSPRAPSELGTDPGPGPWRLSGITLSGEAAAIELRGGAGAQVAQQAPTSVTIRVPATIATRPGPSLLWLHFEPRSDGEGQTFRALSALLDDGARLDRLDQRYGALPVDQARQAAGRAVARSFDAVDVLGFSFSPQRFPLAIVVLAALVQGGILASLENARRQGAVLTKAASDSAVHVLTEHRLGRALLWIALPPLSVAAALPPALLSAGEILAIAVGAVLSALLGTVCLVRSRPLF